MEKIDKFEFSYEEDRNGTIKPLYHAEKRVYVPDPTLKELMPKIEIAIKVESSKPEDYQLMRDLFSLLFDTIKQRTISRLNSAVNELNATLEEGGENETEGTT